MGLNWRNGTLPYAVLACWHHNNKRSGLVLHVRSVLSLLVCWFACASIKAVFSISALPRPPPPPLSLTICLSRSMSVSTGLHVQALKLCFLSPPSHAPPSLSLSLTTCLSVSVSVCLHYECFSLSLFAYHSLPPYWLIGLLACVSASASVCPSPFILSPPPPPLNTPTQERTITCLNLVTTWSHFTSRQEPPRPRRFILCHFTHSIYSIKGSFFSAYNTSCQGQAFESISSWYCCSFCLHPKRPGNRGV